MKNKTTLERGSWKIVINELVKGSPQAEVRNGTGVVVIVSLGAGYVYRHYGRPDIWMQNKELGYYTRNNNIHFAINGPLQCTFDEWNEIQDLIYEAEGILMYIEMSRDIWEGSDKKNAFPGLNDMMKKWGCKEFDSTRGWGSSDESPR